MASDLENIRQRFQGPTPVPPVIPEQIPDLTARTEPLAGFTPITSVPTGTSGDVLSQGSNAAIDSIRDELTQTRLEIATLKGRDEASDTNDLKNLAYVGMAQHLASGGLANGRRHNKGKYIATAAAAAFLGAAGALLFVKESVQDRLAAAAAACATPTTDATVPFIPVAGQTQTEAPAATDGTPPYLFTAGDTQQATAAIAGNLQLNGQAHAIQQYADGSFVQSNDTVFEWNTLTMNPEHTNYVIELRQLTPTGYLTDATMQQMLSNGDYSQEEIIQFVLANNIIDPNVSTAYLKIVGSDDEVLATIVAGAAPVDEMNQTVGTSQ